MTLAEITVPYSFLNNPDGSGAMGGNWTMGASTRTLNFLVSFANLESFCSQVAGYPQAFGSGAAALVTQQQPLVYPFNSRLYAQGIAARAAATNPGDPAGISAANPFTSAVVTVTFGSYPFTPSDGNTPWLDVKIQGATEFITLPGTAYSYVGNGEKIEQDIGRLIGIQTYSITRLQVPSMDAWLALANPLLGLVSSDVVTIGQTAHAAGTILFPTQDLSTQSTILGTPQSQATLSLVYRSIGWNQGVRSDGTVDTITPAPYPTAPLSPLLQ